MTFDPFGGRMPTGSQQAAYANALEITPNDDRDLPVIPSAIFIPPMVRLRVPANMPSNAPPLDENGGFLADDPEGVIANYSNVHPWDFGQPDGGYNEISLMMQNGQIFTVTTPPTALLSHHQQPLILPVRARRIMRTGTRFQRLVLLW